MEETTDFKYFDGLNSEGVESLPDLAYWNLELWIKGGLLEALLKDTE